MEYFKNIFLNELGKPNILLKIIIVISIFLIVSIFLRVINKIIKKFLQRYELTKIDSSKKLSSIISIFMSIIKYIAYFIVVIITLNMFGVNTFSLVATAGVGGIIIAFGVQSIVRDFFTGTFILFDNQYHVGDDVNINNIEGEVISINFRNTQIKGYDGSINILSHGSITNVINYSKGPIRSIIYIYLPIDTNIGEIKELISLFSAKFFNKYDTVVKPPSYFGVMDMGANYIKIGIALWSKPSNQWNNEKYCREEFIDLLKKNKIKFLDYKLIENDYVSN